MRGGRGVRSAKADPGADGEIGDRRGRYKRKLDI